MKKTVTVEVRREHLERARILDADRDTDRTKCCLIAQALTDAGCKVESVGEVTVILENEDILELPPAACRLIELFDDGKFDDATTHRDVEILALLPVSFTVEVEAQS